MQEVLKKLFPAMVATRNAFAQIRRNPYDDLADDQRIASEYYFERFFTYNVPLTEVRDSQIASVLAGIDTRDVKETGVQLQKIIDGFTSAGPDRLIDKLSLRRKLLDIEVSRKLAPALCCIGHNFEGFVEGGFPFLHPSDAALLVRQLVLNVPRQVWGDPPLNWRSDTIKQMLDVCPIEARAILFLHWCLVAIGAKDEEQKSHFSVYGSYQYSSSSDSEPLISNDEFAALNPQIANKINKVHQSGYLYDFKNRRVSRDLVDVWIRCSSSQKVGDLVQKAIEQNPKRAIAVVRWYIDRDNIQSTLSRESSTTGFTLLQIPPFFSLLSLGTLAMHCLRKYVQTIPVRKN